MATRTITLRSGDARDIATIDTLMTAAFDPRFGEAWTRNQCLGVIAMPRVGMTIALVDDEPAGFALVRTVADGGRSYYIRGDHRATVPALRRAVLA